MSALTSITPCSLSYSQRSKSSLQKREQLPAQLSAPLLSKQKLIDMFRNPVFTRRAPRNDSCLLKVVYSAALDKVNTDSDQQKHLPKTAGLSDVDPISSPLRIAYQGVPGAYSEVAALKAVPLGEPYPCAQFETAFQTVSQWMADMAVLPVENSLGGSIHAVYDLLLRYRLHIVGETSVSVDHCLLALPGVKMEDIKRVISHPQALAQCDGYLRSMGVTREEVDDTAGAAMQISKSGWRDTAAIASARAAELYNMERIDTSIQDNKDNITRFIVLARDPLLKMDQQKAGQLHSLSETTRWKTSIVFSLAEGLKPGQLFKALSVFALRDIDLTKIESRPMRTAPLITGNSGGAAAPRRFNYLFYVDFIGSLSEEPCQNALGHLHEICPFCRVLGSYPVDNTM